MQVHMYTHNLKQKIHSKERSLKYCILSFISLIYAVEYVNCWCWPLTWFCNLRAGISIQFQNHCLWTADSFMRKTQQNKQETPPNSNNKKAIVKRKSLLVACFLCSTWYFKYFLHTSHILIYIHLFLTFAIFQMKKHQILFL